eukprot:415171_1
MAARCIEEKEYEYTDSYLQYAIATPITLFLQLTLIYNSIKHFRSLMKVKPEIRIPYFILQLGTLLFLLSELLKNIILANNIEDNRNQFYCNIISYNPLLLIICYFVLLLHVFIRLDFIFRDSVYRLPKFTRIFLICFLCIPPLTAIIIFVILSGDACIWDWYPMDGHIINKNLFYVCGVNYSNNSKAIYTIYICLAWDVIMNIIIAILFYYKLKLLLTHANVFNVTTKDIMIKHTLLTIACIFSTLVSWTLWLLFNLTNYGKIIVYFDMWLNGLFMALMFNFNKKYYAIMEKKCSCCIKYFGNMNDEGVALIDHNQITNIELSR